jgi:hypothetical protein
MGGTNEEWEEMGSLVCMVGVGSRDVLPGRNISVKQS